MHFNQVSQTNCSKTYNKEATGLKNVITRNRIKSYKKKASFQISNSSNPEVKHMTQQPGDYNFCLKLHRLWGVPLHLSQPKDTINTTLRPHKFCKFALNQLVGCVVSSFTTQNICWQQTTATGSFFFFFFGRRVPASRSLKHVFAQPATTVNSSKNKKF